MTKSYSELSELQTYKERFDYLKLNGAVGKETFAHERYLNQVLYKSKEWRSARDRAIIRDGGCDLGIEGMPITKAIVHHINPITVKQVLDRDPEVFDLNNLITVDYKTHNAIHYSDEKILQTREPVERVAGDTTPWKTVS